MKNKKLWLAALAGTAIAISALACAPRFGSAPGAAERARLEKSPNYQDGVFHNQLPTPMFAEGVTFMSTLWDTLFNAGPDLRPSSPLPAVKTDLKALPPDRDAAVWLGHSSYFLILGGRRILLDPVIEPYAAPFSAFNKAFPGTTLYAAADFPDIDLLLLTHDHWDHLEYPTLRALQPRVAKVLCGLGVGSHLRRWGYRPEQIQELDWYDAADAGGGLVAHAVPARHFSGRWLARNRTLWTGFALISPERKIFISGDSGYGPHFKEAGEKFGGFDLAIMEDGQYDARWPYIHMQPEESVAAALEVGAKAVIPCHNGRFCISNHPWREPVERFRRAGADKDFKLLLPIIGEPVFL